MFRPFAIFLTLAIVYLVTVDVSGADKWTSDQEQIVVANNACIQAILAADVASLMNFYADDVVLLPPSEPAVVGKKAVSIYWAEAIFIAAEAGVPMKSVSEARLEEGQGIVGDRYYAGVGTFSEKLKGRPDSEVTLIESEQIDQFNDLHGLELDYGSPRRNVVTQGIELNKLVDVQFRVGEALLEGIRLCEPCAHLAGLITEKVLPGLVHRGGLRARIISGGVIRPADSIDAT